MNTTEVEVQLTIISLSVLCIFTLNVSRPCSTTACITWYCLTEKSFCKQYSMQFSLLLEIRRERRILSPPKINDQFATVGNSTTGAKLGSWSDPTEQRIALCMFEESGVGSGSLIDSARERNQSCNLKCKSFQYSLIPVLQQL